MPCRTAACSQNADLPRASFVQVTASIRIPELDGAPVPLQLLPDVAREVGNDIEIHLDTGITSGADIVAAIALGARFAMVGRAYLYGLMAGGRAGVDRMIAIMRGDIERTMRLLGATRLDELAPRHVTLPGR
jgi:L-lactate dehydrogenase (cytochrome)